MKFYDLAGHDREFSFSFNPWKARMCINLKGVDYERIPYRFTEIQRHLPNIIKPGQECLVPVIEDGDQVIQNSVKIAEYLDEKYPANPIFQGSKHLEMVLYDLFENQVAMSVFVLCVLDMLRILDKEDKEYFIRTRTPRFGNIETFVSNKADEAVLTIEKVFSAVSQGLKRSRFISGDKIGWSDITLASHLLMLNRLNEANFLKVIEEHSYSPQIKRWWRDMQYLVD